MSGSSKSPAPALQLWPGDPRGSDLTVRVRSRVRASQRRRLLAAVVLGVSLSASLSPARAGDTPTEGFWDVQRRGANSFNKVESVDNLAAAKTFGAGFVRLAFDKWKGEGRDFLAGDLDHYRGLVPADLAKLKVILDGAAARGVKVVIVPLGLPGARWSQLNGNVRDDRLWRDEAWWDAAAAYWRDLATALKGHPAIVAYNVLNEPAPEFGQGLSETSQDVAARDRWCRSVAGTPRDLDAFYRKMVAAIRSVDPDTPIMLDTGFYAQPMAARCLSPIADLKVLYSVHLYEPYAFTSRHNDGRYHYPGAVDYDGSSEMWNRDRLAAQLAPFTDWAKSHGVPASRLVGGEFGCVRWNDGCGAYLADQISVMNAAGLHWAFYSFREDEWDAYDYELGTKKLGWRYWEAVEKGQHPSLVRKPNPLSDVLSGALAAAPSKPAAPNGGGL
ncbi:glycoside hydrolase family 5 protein [Segnochrobactrum spirostomi]|uniref:Glycoside hydrolase family 5 protein n=1 Tax=Segnochrobactrum spirostomi TaxID=2608987 RepID=A0A6A7XXF9_9HYPH|nr:cellulase family glycosylhydrolase [Segnochrobactrum spirostomi]MQT11294.1 glycoside hydrolase family 5 protein [Segnochrobactrum spirostomi]